MRNCRYVALVSLLVVPLWVLAQSDVGSVTGTVADNSGAVISGATVELTNPATHQSQTTKTNAAGQYVFARVAPATYKVTVSAHNFATAVVNDLQVFVGKMATANVTMQVGGVNETIEVQAGATELQTMDASVGSVITNEDFRNAPNLGRDATGLVLLQPGAMPTQAGDENYGGQVMGARSDQNTFMVDGGDITNNTDALGSYAGRNNFSGVPHGAVPTPVESLEEFRVVTNNSIGGFNRSAGAEVQMVTRRGTNAWHGSGYEYMIQDETNANSWALNHTGTKKPEWRDNRFGGSLGGPIFKDKTFFFLNVESRHFLQGNTVSRWTPTASARAGQITYLSPTGYKTISLASMDPLGLGLNPTVAALWNSMPLPNDAGGDGGNFGVFTGSAPITTNSESAVARLDHQLTKNWHLTGTYRYGVEDNSTTNQTLMTATGYKSLSSRPVWGNYGVIGLTGQITQNFVNDLHLDFLRSYWKWGDAGNQPVAGLGGALQLRSESVTSGVVPINEDTQQSRQRLWDGKDYNIIDNVSWSKGKHLVEFGGRIGWQRFTHLRNDKVTGGTSFPIYYATWSGGTYNMNISGSQLPADICTPATCPSSGLTAYKAAYVAMLGMVSQATQVLTRNADLSPKPAGTWVTAKSAVDNWQLSFSDAWRIKPSLTLSYGLTWGVQLPPYEQNRAQTVMVDAATGKPFSVDQYLGTRQGDALQGNIYNPVIGFQPIAKTSRKYPFDPDYTNLGPRLALAWNPSFGSTPLLGRLFGDRKTVIRAGWTRAFDRVNGVDIVMTPALGIGFADLGVCNYPRTDGTCSSTKSDPTNAFRVGVNGKSLSIPGLPGITPPVIPGDAPGANVPFSNVDWHIDPRKQLGSTDVLTLSIQREMPKNTLLEIGFVGRLSRDLYEKVDLNSVPYMYTVSGQTFASAFDAVQKALIAGQTPAIQPFFETALGGTSSYYCSHKGKVLTAYSSCTAAVAAKELDYITARDVGDTWLDLDGNWSSGNGQFLRTDETYSMDITTNRGKARYAGLYVSARKGGRDLTYSLNYTLSKSLDSYGFNQDIIDVMMDAYDPQRAYGLSNFDRRQVFNGMATWQLPVGRGKRWLTSGFLEKVLGGFSVSPIFTTGTGIPEFIYSNSACGYEYGGSIYSYADCASMVPLNSGSWNMSRNNTTTVTDGYGSQSTGKIPYPNAFANAGSFISNFRLPYFTDTRRGNQNWMHGLGYWNFDVSIGKTTRIGERVTTRFSADLINAFNHPNMRDPSTDIDNPSTFGVLTRSDNLPRYIQWGLRFDF